MKQKDNLKLINYFLKTQEQGYMPNFLFSKSKKKIKTKIYNISDNDDQSLNHNIIVKSRNDVLDPINTVSNIQYDKSKYLTPFQKLLKLKKDIKLFNDKKKNLNLKDSPIEIMPTIKSDRKDKTKIVIHSKNQINNSPKEYLNKIKLYKTKSYGYNTVKNEIFSYDINVKKNNEIYYTLGNKDKKNPLRKMSIDKNKLKETINKNDLNLYMNDELFLQLSRELNDRLKLKKLKLKKKFFKNNYEQLIHNIETDKINSPKTYIKKENRNKNKNKKINIYSNDIRYLLCFSPSRKRVKNKDNNNKLNFNTSLNMNISNNIIGDIRKNNNISSLFFSPEFINNGRYQQSRNYRLKSENNTNY